MKRPTARVGDLAEQIRGVTYGKEEARTAPEPGFLPILRAGNIKDDRLELTDLVYIPEGRIGKAQRLRKNDILIATSSGSLDVVGKAAIADSDFEGGFGAFCKVLRPGAGVVPSYLAHFFRTSEYRQRISSLAAGANINNLRNEHLDDLIIPWPPLDTQQRIAAILDQADALRAMRRSALAKLDALSPSTFLELFGDPIANPRRWPADKHLVDVAEIVSGITKGRKIQGESTRPVPYLAVANVQDRALNLRGIKSIEATQKEIERLRLKDGDLVLTEGGDPDKLGRGTIWRGELRECIHQNHIFRVRITAKNIDPLFLSWLISSSRGKNYFLKSAKQTTGIASINMTQLRGFPLLVPPLDLQREFARRVQAIDALKDAQRRSLAKLDALFASLQHRAFRGKL